MFAENLKKVMNQKGITSAALARKSGFSKGAVSQWRNGIYTPSHENMLILAEALQCSIEELNGEAKAAELIPGKTNKVTLTVEEAARLMHVRQSYIADGLKYARPGFEFGSAVPPSEGCTKWRYKIYANKFTEITGIPVNV